MTPTLALLAVLLDHSVPAAAPPAQSTLVIIATGTTQERKQLEPALDALCATFDTDSGGFKDVIRLSVDTDLSVILQELPPTDLKGPKGSFLRHLQGGIQAGAFVSCRDGRVVARLPEPLEVVLFSLSFVLNAEANAKVSRYEVRKEVIQIGYPFHIHVNLFDALQSLGQCAARRFWSRPGLDPDACRRFAPRAPEPPPAGSGPKVTELPLQVHASPSAPVPKRSSRWWVWAVVGGGVLVAGAVTAVAIAGGGGSRPACPEPYRCGGQ